MDKKQIYNSVYGFAIGDACGVPYEFLDRDECNCTDMIACNEDSMHQVGLGTWSDDTSLLLCILNALCEKKDNKIFEKYKKNCISWMYAGKFTADDTFPFDIGDACRRGIISLKTGGKNYFADDKMSNGNGGLMRILPIAFLDINTDDEIMKYINMFNSCSHNHIISNVGCLIYIKLIKNLANGYSLKDSLIKLNIDDEYKIDYYRRIWDLSILDCEEQNIRSTGYVVDTLESAIWALNNSKDYKSAIFTAINLGNDTDTIAGICGGMAGIIYDIPDDLKNKLKNKKLIDENISRFIKNKYL